MPPKKKPAALSAKQEEEELSEMVRKQLNCVVNEYLEGKIVFFFWLLQFRFNKEQILGDKTVLPPLVDQSPDNDPTDETGKGWIWWGGLRR